MFSSPVPHTAPEAGDVFAVRTPSYITMDHHWKKGLLDFFYCPGVSHSDRIELP